MKVFSMFCMVLLVGVVVLASDFVQADEVSESIKGQIKQIALLSNPQATEADKIKIQELYQSVKTQGAVAVPVIEEFLKSKDNASEKLASLYLAGVILAPLTIEETDTKGKHLQELMKIGLADESEQVKVYALKMVGGMVEGLWRGDSYSILKNFFENEKNTQMRIYALSRIAGFYNTFAYDVIVSALNDTDPAVRQAAASYKAYHDEINAKNAESATAPASPSETKSYGKNAN